VHLELVVLFHQKLEKPGEWWGRAAEEGVCYLNWFKRSLPSPAFGNRFFAYDDMVPHLRSHIVQYPNLESRGPSTDEKANEKFKSVEQHVSQLYRFDFISGINYTLDQKT